LFELPILLRLGGVLLTLPSECKNILVLGYVVRKPTKARLIFSSSPRLPQTCSVIPAVLLLGGNQAGFASCAHRHHRSIARNVHVGKRCGISGFQCTIHIYVDTLRNGVNAIMNDRGSSPHWIRDELIQKLPDGMVSLLQKSFQIENKLLRNSKITKFEEEPFSLDAAILWNLTCCGDSFA